MAPKNFFTELKRRNVNKVAVAYAIVGWLSIQIATQGLFASEQPGLAKPVSVGVVSQRSIPTGKQFSLQTRIATMEGGL